LTFLASQIKPGYWVTLSKGFPETTKPYEVTATDPVAGWIEVERNATSSETGIDVTTKPNYYTDGNGGAYARTVLNAVDRNAIQEELCNVIIDNGGSLDANDRSQISNAIALLNRANTFLQDQTIAAGKKIKCDSFSETTPSNGCVFSNAVKAFAGFLGNTIAALTGDTIDVNNDLDLNNNEFIRGQKVYSNTDYTAISTSWYKITIDAGAYNTHIFQTASSLLNLKININNGKLGSEITIINDGDYVAGFKSLILWIMGKDGVGSVKKNIKLGWKGSVTLRRVRSAAPADGPARLGLWPHEGNTAYMWELISTNNVGTNFEQVEINTSLN